MKLRYLLALFLLLPTWAGAATHTCNNHAEMVAAIAALANDDTVVINASWDADDGYDFYGYSGITIYGTLGTETITMALDDTYTFKIGSSSTIRDFVIDGAKDSFDNATQSMFGVYVQGTGSTVSGMTITDTWGTSIYINGDTNTVTGNTVNTPGGVGITTNQEGDCIRFTSGADGNTASYNILTGESGGGSGIFIWQADNSIITGNSHTSIPRKAIYAGGTTPNESSGTTITGEVITDWATDTAENGISLHSVVGTTTVQGCTITQTTDTAYAAWGIEVGAVDGATTILQDNTIGGANLDIGISAAWHNLIIRRNTIGGAMALRLINFNADRPLTASYNLMLPTGSTYGVHFSATSAGNKFCKLYNNTIIDKGTGTIGVYLEEVDGDVATGMEVVNNIIQGFTKGVVVDDDDSDGVNLVHTDNDYYGNTDNLQEYDSEAYVNISLDASELTSDPLFVSVGTDDFRLTTTSPCIDTGADVSLTLDKNSDTVPWGSAPDIGAYEYSAITISGCTISGGAVQ